MIPEKKAPQAAPLASAVSISSYGLNLPGVKFKTFCFTYEWIRR